MTGLTWHPGFEGSLAAEVGGRTIAIVNPRGWWSSYLLGVSLPCAELDDGKARVEAAWADWMERAGLVWADRPRCRCSQADMRDRAVETCRVSAQDVAEGDWGPEGHAMAHMLRDRISALPVEDCSS